MDILTRLKLVEFLNTYLELDDAPSDISWNGLQFEGRNEVQKIAFAVDASLDSFMAAARENADFLIVHHGHFWQGSNPSYSGWAKKRLDFLYQHQLSLYAAHAPLDRHKEVGNNAQLLKLLGAEITSEFMIREGKNIGWIGTLKNPKPLSEIRTILVEKLVTSVKTLDFSKESVSTIAVCSGGGGYHGFMEALNAQVDLYISGDAVEIYSTAKDAEMNVIFAGHNATETIGLKALQNVIEKKFKVETVFIDLPTGL